MKKMIALVIVLALCLSVLPLAAMAAETTYAVTGDFNGWDNNSDAHEMTLSGETYSVTVSNCSAGFHGFKVVKKGTWDGPLANNAGFYCTAAGDVTISYTPGSGVSVTGTCVDTSTATVHAKVPADWGSSINIWAWTEVQPTANVSAAAWSGDAVMTQDGDWFTYDIPVWVEKIIILKGDGSAQSATYTIEKGKDLWLDLTANTPGISYTDPAAGGVIVPVEVDYYLVGSGPIFTTDWTADDAHKLTKQDDESYSKTYTDVPAGTYKLKVHSPSNNGWYGDNSGNGDADGNYYFSNVAEGSTLSVTFANGTASITVTAPSGGVVVPDKYVVAGDEALTGENWNAASEKNEMVESNGVYTLTYADVPAGTYKFKVVLNGTTWIPSGTGNDQIVYTVAAGDVTITYDPATGVTTVEAEGAPTEDRYVVAGSEGLCGTAWSATDEDNLMAETSEGVYAITYTAVAAGEYELKVVLNGTNWIGGADGNNVYITVSEACDVTVTYSAASGIQVTGANVTVGAPTNTPTTGDSTNLIAVIAVMILSGALLVTTVSSKKRFF